MTGAKRGPKPKAPEDKRSVRIEVTATPDEAAVLAAGAAVAGLPVAVYLRETTLRRARRKHRDEDRAGVALAVGIVHRRSG